MVELATFPRCLSIHWTYEGHCESFRAFQCQVLEIEMPSLQPSAFSLDSHTSPVHAAGVTLRIPCDMDEA